MLKRAVVLMLSALLAAASGAEAQNALVVSAWGGNWKDSLEKIVAKSFTAKTGIPVEFEVGGTIDRLAKEAIRSEYHIGVWAYVYTVVYRPDLVKEDITKWSDLWKPSLKGKIAMPDFDPSHIITIAALMEGGNETTWEKGQKKLLELKPQIAAFFATDAQSQDLMKTGQAPVQVMLSVNAYHLIDQGLQVKLVQPADYPGVIGIDTMMIMTGTKKADAAYQFINLALSKDIQAELVKSLKASPTVIGTAVPANLAGRPGIFVAPPQWKEKAYIINDEVRAKNLPAWREWFTSNIVKK